MRQDVRIGTSAYAIRSALTHNANHARKRIQVTFILYLVALIAAVPHAGNLLGQLKTLNHSQDHIVRPDVRVGTSAYAIRNVLTQ